MENDNLNMEDSRLKSISELIGQFAQSDFKIRISPSGKGDELDSVIYGLNKLGEELAAKSLQSFREEKRINEIVNILLRYVCMDFSEKIQMSGENDELDAVILGLNTLSEELETNIRQLKQSMLELSEANDALKAFSYSVSHDLRAPVRSVLGFTQIIQKNYSAGFNQDLNGLFEHIQKSAIKMNVIIDDMLSLAKCDKEKMDLAPVNMKNLVNTVWKNVLLTSPFKGTFQVADLPDVKADTSMVEQVLANLLSNAVKYSSGKTEPAVMMGYEKSNGKITFFVKDNGAGFDMKNYNHLFGAFQRLHSPTEFEGTGIGLTIVKRIIKMHGGTVWAEGKVNEGATFYFTLPAI